MGLQPLKLQGILLVLSRFTIDVLEVAPAIFAPVCCSSDWAPAWRWPDALERAAARSPTMSKISSAR
jgi:hypothetical protein